jgi:hypothetical protein
MSDEMLKAVQEHWTDVGDGPVHVSRGELVPKGHAIARQNPDFFAEAKVESRFVEQATAAPGEKRDFAHTPGARGGRRKSTPRST